MRLLRSYIFWTYERGSLHYDVMVTLILAFLFISPRFIDFKDKPVRTVPLEGSEVLVKAAGHAGESERFMYEIRADQMGEIHSAAECRTAVLRAVEPIAGEVTAEGHCEPVRDGNGKVVAYDAWVIR